MRSIAVTGMGCLCAAGGSVREAMLGLQAAPSPMLAGAIRERGIFADEPEPQQLVGPVFAASHSELWPSRVHTSADTLTLARLAALEALAQGGFEPQEASRRGRLGVALGSTVGGSLYLLRVCADLERRGVMSEAGLQEADDYFQCNPALALGRELNAAGPLLTVANACASGADAIGQACRWLDAGLCDIALAGGADALNYVPYVGFSRLMLYDASPSRPFSIGRKGLNLGDGAGVLLLERAEDAERRGARALGHVIGYGAFNDAHHLTAPHPQGHGLARAVTKALRDAAHEGSEADIAARLAFVNVHGTGTIENDKVEDALMSRMFPGTPLWATKGHTGHTLGAAGGIEAVFSLAALRQGVIPARLDYGADDCLCSSLVTRPTPVQKPYALSTSLGFGGVNSALLFRAAEGILGSSAGEAAC